MAQASQWEPGKIYGDGYITVVEGEKGDVRYIIESEDIDILKIAFSGNMRNDVGHKNA